MKNGLDVGHGGKDPGAVGPTGLYEKDVNLAVGMELKRLLEAAGHQVIITRTGDADMTLLQRTNMLNQAKCDLAISIHCNSSAKPEPNYVATFVQGAGGQAEKLAKCIQPQLVAATGWPDGGVRMQNLHMTRETTMPAVLVELGFISNPAQERQLTDPAFRAKLARAIADGILAYAGVGEKKGVEGLQDVKVVVKGKDIPGKLENGRTWVPLRDLIEALAPEIIWDEKARVVVVK